MIAAVTSNATAYCVFDKGEVPMQEFMKGEDTELKTKRTARRDAEQRLIASRDRISGKCVFPQIPERSPAASRYEPVTLSRVATIYSYSVIHPNPKTGEKPFVVIYADFPEGARAFGRLDLAADARPVIGERVVAQTEDRAEGTPSYVFILAEGMTR